jgi:predicted ferric reductase
VKRAVAIVVALLAAHAVAARLGFVLPLPAIPGTAMWAASRAAGVTAFVALTLDVVFGLFVSTGVFDRWLPRGASVDVHRWLSSVALAFTGVHLLALLVDPAIHFDALDLLVPGLSPYRAGATAVGIAAMYGAVVVHASFDWRKRIGVRAWRMIHFTAFAVFVAAVAHGLTAGSDAGSLRPLYAGCGALVFALVVVRVVHAASRSSAASIVASSLQKQNRTSPRGASRS